VKNIKHQNIYNYNLLLDLVEFNSKFPFACKRISDIKHFIFNKSDSVSSKRPTSAAWQVYRVKQWCVLSPALFSVFGPQILHVLFYAADVGLLEETESDLLKIKCLISLIRLHANGNLTLKTHVEQLSTIVGRKMEFHGAVPIEIIMLAYNSYHACFVHVLWYINGRIFGAC
jgi:hypothetical protein